MRVGSQFNLFWNLLRSIWTGVLRGEMKGEAGGDWGSDWRGEIGWVVMFNIRTSFERDVDAIIATSIPKQTTTFHE